MLLFSTGARLGFTDLKCKYE